MEDAMTNLNIKNTKKSEDQFAEKNEILVNEILRRFSRECPEQVAYIQGEAYMASQRQDYYDLIGIFSDEKGWEVMPIPVFHEIFGNVEELTDGESIRWFLQPMCEKQISRYQWEEETTTWTIAHEKFSRTIDTEFRKELKKWLKHSDEELSYYVDDSGQDAVSNGTTWIVYSSPRAFEIWEENFSRVERIALSRANPKLFKKLGGSIRV